MSRPSAEGDRTATERESGPGKLVGALVNGLAVLRYLQRSSAPVGVTQVARDLELNPSTCFNLLRTLVHEKLAVFDEQTKCYSLGLGVVSLAQSALDKHSHLKLLHPDLMRIAARHGVTMNAWYRVSEDRVLLVDRAEPEAVIHVSMNLGQRLPAYAGALGRCFAAYDAFDVDKLSSAYGKVRMHDPLPVPQWLAEVEETRRRGYAVDRERFALGFTTASAPVFGEDEAPFLALSAIAVSARLDDDALHGLALEMVETARYASRRLVT